MSNYLEVVDGINNIQYGTTELHRLLSQDENIGINCENLTIAILSLNRSKATIKLLKSIESKCKDFQGKILVCDNGSDENDLKQIENAIKSIKLDCKLVKFNQNFGVAKGRNEAVKYVKTDWVMFLDNDIYFIKDIFPETQKAIAQLGCKFINLPLLNSDKETIFTYGGQIYLTLDKDGVHIGCGSTFKQNNVNDLIFIENCLATFLFGGCSIINKKTFLQLGGFDEGMFIGFEDIDFSIRIFNEGLKIGCSKAIGLVHEHIKSEEKSDYEYEKKRFSYNKLLESAKYFENKHNFKVWNNETNKWLKEQEKRLHIEREEKKIKVKQKTKIALIVDVRDWALDNIAKNIVKHLSDKYEFKIVYMSDIPDSRIMYLFYACQGCKIVHFLWRGLINFLDQDNMNSYLSYYGSGSEYFHKEILDKFIITFSVYDHNFLKDDFKVTERLFNYSDCYTVSSKKLYDIYNNLGLIKPMMEITDGVDTEKFIPMNLERFDNVEGRKLILGWVGNSNYYGDEDHKGINTIIKPAIKELIEEGYNIELKVVDKQKNYVSHDDMPKYYQTIDVYICASTNEGTPNPVLESMACGVPIITTDVGIVAEAFGNKQKEYILVERTKKCLKENIKKIINNKEILKELSKENLVQIKGWTWQKKCEDFDKFFQKVLKEKEEK